MHFGKCLSAVAWIMLPASTFAAQAAAGGAAPAQRVEVRADANRGAAADLYGLTSIVRVRIELSAEEYKAVEPPGPAAGPGAPPVARAPKRSGRPSERNLFGIEFPWARGSVEIGGNTFRDASIRYSGNASYFASAGGLKRSFVAAPAPAAQGASPAFRTLLLQSGVLDASKAREVLAYAIFREAGVPAPRTAFAAVSLSVPGERRDAFLGLYTLVEPVDAAFLRDRFGTDGGLLLHPQGLRGLDDLGDDWSRYRGPYRPLAEPKPEQAKRLIEFVRLVNSAPDDDFRRQIADYLDIDAFFRFMTAHALVANADGFFTLGYNYYLYLNPTTNRFVFIPGDQEQALANFLMMGSPNDLMNISLDRPYGGENRLADRLLAAPELAERRKAIVRETAVQAFRKDRLTADAEAIERAIAPIVRREAEARAERGEPPAGLGPAGLGPAGAAQAPGLKAFIQARSESIDDQLKGKREGYRPRFNFGPPGGGAAAKPIDDETFGNVVKPPPGFRASLYAAPPRVNYPVAVSVAWDGAVYVAIDEQGSLGRTPGGGRVVRCIDDDGDGKADRTTVFARMDHPRGLVASPGKVWVLHPPKLSVFTDADGDGVSESNETLVTGLTTSLIDERGGDHTTNGIRMGLDGWIYIAVGDYGFHVAKGKDGITLSQRGGGVLRVRPDGTELEVFAVGLRNPFAIAIDPYMNLFTRDNTNDGAGWDVRVSHLVETADYGYPLRFANFTDETMPPLGAYGQGGGTGALYLDDGRWPAAYRGVLLTGDWGRSELYRHSLAPSGASFRSEQKVFFAFPRPTGMDLGPDGRLYAASWRGGEASVYIGQGVGFLACIAPPDWRPSAGLDLKSLGASELIAGLADENAVLRYHRQRELVRRGPAPETIRELSAFAADSARPIPGRIAALFALKQIAGAASHPALSKLAADPALREFALRALADRKTELTGVDPGLFRSALSDRSDRVRAQAIIGLVRLGDRSSAAAILPLTARPEGSPPPSKKPIHAQPDPERAIPHLAARALVLLGASDACLEALTGPYREGALRALRSMHDPKAVEGLIKKLAVPLSSDGRRDILAALVRLHFREAPYEGTWWGIRPDTTGPYFDPTEWECTQRIASVLRNAWTDGDAETRAFLGDELARRRVPLAGVAGAHAAGAIPESETLVKLVKADLGNPDQIGNLTYETAARRTLQATGDAVRGKAIFAQQSCRACHTDADGQTPKGPHLVEIGKRLSAPELVESILKPSAKIAQGYETYAFALGDGRVLSGFVVSEGAKSVRIRESNGALRELAGGEIEERRRVESSIMPEGVAANLTPEALADLVAYLGSLNP